MRTIKREIVGGLLISSDNKVLIGKNRQGGVHEDVWVVPGGGIDEGEKLQEALRRELLEEVGIDVKDAVIEQVGESYTGTAEKTLRETNERVLVEMTFYDFLVTMDRPASEIPFSLDDDFAHAEWVSKDELTSKDFSPFTRKFLERLKFI